jgi:gas vesicle protein/uncharacterized membrane protein YeaQ/YmgE (transglycosylase-associated protein family)
MDWLKTLAPLLGTALGGPIGGAAAAFIADKLGIEDKTIEAVSEVLNSGKLSPEQITGLKLAEIDFQKFLEQNKVDLARLSVDNTKDARAMQIITRSQMPAIISVILTTGFLGLLTGLMAGWLKAEDNQAMLIMLGALGAGFGAVINYWLGSSSDSGRKTELLAQAPSK